MIFTGSAIAFLLLVCAVVPLLAVQSARRLGGRPLPVTREQLFANVIATQLFLLAIAWFTAREGGIRLWRSPRHLAWPAAVVILAVALVLLRLRWPSRTPESKARLYGMLPRNARERLPYAGVCIAAGIAEEIVYRGVLVALLASYTHNVIIAAVISAVVFGISHSIQGRRAVVAIAAIGLVLQSLVAIADSLVPAMVVHALYDFAAGVLIPRWYERAGTILGEFVPGGAMQMATIDQPTPSSPHGTHEEQRPLQPGQTPTGRTQDVTPSRPNFQTKDVQKERPHSEDYEKE